MALLSIQSSATVQPAGGGSVSIAGAGTIAVASGVTQPIVVSAAIVSPYGAVLETVELQLWPGGAPVSLADPGAGNVWVVFAETVSRVETVGIIGFLVGASIYGIAGWQIGSWIGHGIQHRRQRRVGAA